MNLEARQEYPAFVLNRLIASVRSKRLLSTNNPLPRTGLWKYTGGSKQVLLAGTAMHSSVPRAWHLAFWGGAVFLALISARPYAGSWNDGSRLATVEVLVDHHTLAIDRSVFVQVPPETIEQGIPPYQDPGCQKTGTFDKLLIDGHFYSDKPALISFLMAVLYQSWQWLGGPSAAARPDLFCLLLTGGTSGLAYLTALICCYLLGRRLGLSQGLSLLLCASLGFATVALVYARHVNNHLMLLGVMAALILQLTAYAQEWQQGRAGRSRLLLIGTLAGVGYALDLGLGPVLMVCLTLAIFWRGGLSATALLLTGAVPWLAAHHVLNYALGGTFKPVNTVPEYLAFPGGPFNPENMTGFLRPSLRDLIVYPLALLYGKHGLIGYNLPLLLAPLGLGVCWKKSRPEALFVAGWGLGGWLMYGLFSNNYGGVCCSIRWFVPFLAAGFYLIAHLLKEKPHYAWDLAILSAWSMLLTVFLWERGPWSNKIPLVYWPIQLLALAAWVYYRSRHAPRAVATVPPAEILSRKAG